jgi:PAS domain-containing protein
MGEHEMLVKGMAEQFKEVLEKSPQAIYLYLDDTHKVCNKMFSDLLGYASPQLWAETEAPLEDVIEEDRPSVVRAYQSASGKFKAVTVTVRFHNMTTHRSLTRQMTVVPVPFKGNVFTAHFIDKP